MAIQGTQYSKARLRIAMNFRFGKDFGLFVSVNNDLQIEGVNDNAFQFRTTAGVTDTPIVSVSYF